MPITPEYTWSETAEEVLVHVVLRGAIVRKPELTATAAFLKISSPPYLLLLDLNGDVCFEAFRAEVTASGIDVCLPKVRHNKNCNAILRSLACPPLDLDVSKNFT